MTIGPKAAKVKCAFEKESHNKEILRFPSQSPGAKGGQAGGQASGVRLQENSQTALHARWYVPRLVDDPVASPVPRLFL